MFCVFGSDHTACAVSNEGPYIVSEPEVGRLEAPNETGLVGLRFVGVEDSESAPELAELAELAEVVEAGGLVDVELAVHAFVGIG